MNVALDTSMKSCRTKRKDDARFGRLTERVYKQLEIRLDSPAKRGGCL